MYKRICPVCGVEVIHTNKNNGKRFEGKPCKNCSVFVKKTKPKSYKNLCIQCGVIEDVRYIQRVSPNWLCEKCRYSVVKPCVICGTLYSSRKYDKGTTCSYKCKFMLIAKNMGGDDVVNISQLDKYKINRRVGGGKSQANEENGMYGKSHSSETKQKMRLKRSQRFIETGITPRVNPKACEEIDKFGNTMGYSFQHGLNGGEYYIKELGYWVDGYDAENNIVVEYDEIHHQQEKNKQKDLVRQQQIIEKLGCKFVRLIEQKDGTTLYNILNS